MVKNYLKLALRNLWKSKLVTSINLLGLTLGIGCSLLLFLYVSYERSYDDFMKDGDRIHRLIVKEKGQNGRHLGGTSLDAYNDLNENYAQIEDVLKVKGFGYDMFSGTDVKQKVNVNFQFASSNFLDFFGFPLIAGDPKTALQDPSSIVLTEETAMKLFGHTDVIGKTVTIDATFYSIFRKELVVTGLAEKVENSHLQFEAIVPWDMTNPEGRVIADWFFGKSVFVYVKTPEHVDASLIAAEKNERLLEQFPDADSEYYFHPLKELYLGSGNIGFLGFRKGNLQTVNTLFYIAIVILLVACINYVNLQTAKASKRSLEVGMKKVFGAKRSHLVMQFMTESLLLVLISSLLAVLLIDLVLPFFNNLTGKNFTINTLLDHGLIMALCGVYLITTFLSGIYPSIAISSFNPARVLKKASATKQGNKGVRGALMLLQFGISICLMAITYVIFQQYSFMNEKELGFNKEQVINFGLTGKNIEKSVDAFRAELDQYPNILATSLTTDALGSGSTNNSGTVYSKLDLNSQSVSTIFGVDHQFINTYEMEMVDGRDFDKRLAADSTAVIVNESFVKALGLEDPIDQEIVLYQQGGPSYKIIGVVKDFNFQRLHRNVNPVVIRIAKWNIWQMSVRLAPQDMASTLDFLENKWNEFEPESAFEYEFVDAQLEQFYREEQRMLKAISFFSVISITLTILGLFAMTVFAIEQKMKEISIRRVLGAGVSHVLSLIHKDFLKMLLLAIAIAAPVIYYLGSSWLERFAYRIELTAWPLIVASLITTVIIALIVSSLSYKAAGINPVKTLRNE